MNSVARSQDSTALYAFSADPITYGHIDIVERAAACFAKCIVGIGRNPAKQYLFTLDERKRMAEAALSHLPDVSVMSFEGMVVDFAFEQGAKVIVKGVRSAADMEYEQALHQVGVSQNLGIDTHILFADPKLIHVSSSVVKGMQLEHGFIQNYVPPNVKAALEARLSNQLILGLTGDIASGKSTLAEALVEAGRKRGISVHNIDMDKLGHQILSGEGIGEPMHKELVRDLIARFGEVILDGQAISRRRLAEKVFGEGDSRDYLNHLIKKPMAVLLRRALKDKKGILLLNGALLADAGMLGLCNYRCILCEVDATEQSARLAQRGLSTAQIGGRLTAQLPGKQKLDLIEREISLNKFGMVWRYHKEKSPGDLLEDILMSAGEFQWVS